MIKRLSKRSDCGECYRPFNLFEVVHYLRIDNNTFCADCREKLRPGELDDLTDSGGWIPSLYVGKNKEGRDNVLQLIKLWNESLAQFDCELRIELSE